MEDFKKYGWIPDHKDHRDFKFTFTPEDLLTPLPKVVDLRLCMPSIYSQERLGSCTAHAICSAMQYCEIKKNKEYKTKLSRLFLYYNEREQEGNVDYDSGAQLRTGIKCANSIGICIEEDWSYDANKFKVKPPKEAYDNAFHQEAVNYQSLNIDLDSLRRCLAGELPFVGGISIYESFESREVAKTGIVPMPKEHESFLGGHAILFYGYNDDLKQFKVRNSWGENWGDKGDFYLPYDYVLALAADCWVIQTVN